ncbi:cytochrome-c peroxidase [Psychrosphaera sp. B3R10]|nr:MULTISPECIES: cytochrome-c peroxidase [unclassified Psychrosphaera]MBU2882283.1 cytochrome-c peroxidase [Psychrosphaera sp. I2R16]MBU2988964.1 cytochrome-c peroxidase [Psychrosphaera sp. B3R10]
MDKKYYVALICAVLVCLIVPLLKLFDGEHLKLKEEFTQTRYNFQKVYGAIQPIPTIIEINKEWVSLGKAVFHSPLLSKDNTVSCASCHLIDYGGDDGFPVSTGIKNRKGSRNSPTVLNAVFNFKQFWDGRANTLEEQMLGPIHNPIEMGTTWPEIITKLKNDAYFASQFSELFEDGITQKNITQVIATFEESLITPGSAIDRFILGDSNALTIQQQRGLHLFKSYGCTTCHQGINIGGNIFQKFGRLQHVPLGLKTDPGRYAITNDPNDNHVFKVPSLRNVAETAPYFHNGEIATLDEAVKIMARSQLGRELTSTEIEDIVALLYSFSGPRVEVD